jgi:hypothetical protein
MEKILSYIDVAYKTANGVVDTITNILMNDTKKLDVSK